MRVTQLAAPCDPWAGGQEELVQVEGPGELIIDAGNLDGRGHAMQVGQGR